VPISLPTDRILERCGLTGTGTVYSTRVSSLAGEFAAAFNAMLLPSALADESLTWAISQGVIDLVAADFVEILRREPGVTDVITIGDVRIEPSPYSTAEPMRQRGWARLTPYMKRDMIPEDPRVFGSGDRP
jgi:hypothetical protein